MSWDRRGGSPTAPPPPATATTAICLWCAGFVANRAALLAERGLPAELPDPDLLLRLYADLGTGAARVIAGPFAWILWDERRRRLLAVRDRAGARSLCFVLAGDTFHAGPGVAELVSRLPAAPVLNLRAAVAQIRGEALPPGETFYSGIQALEPGELLTVTAESIERRRYWQLEPRPPVRLASDREYAEAFRTLLFTVVAEYAPRNAAPAAAVTLSGGLDSPSVAAALRATAPGVALTAVTWVAPELPEADESRAAAAVARHLALPAVEIRADLLWPLQNATTSCDADGPFTGYYHEIWDATLQAVAERGIGVLFTGASGDHLVGGNAFAYPDLLLTGRWPTLLRQLRRHLPQSEIGLAAIVRQMLLQPLKQAYLPFLERPWNPSWLTPRGRSLYDPREAEEAPPARLLPGRRLHLTQLRDRRLGRLLEEIGRRAATFGVEPRHPLLDHRLLELAATLPIDQIFRAAERKVVLRNALRPYLPDEVLHPWRKIYPIAIFARGVKERERDKAMALMTGMRAADLGLIDEQRLRAAYQAYLDGEGAGGRFWHTLTLEIWLRRTFG